jgi:uncharacterized spore protein YtfJ
MSQIDDLLADVKDAMNVRRVFAEPYQSNGVTLIPAASLIGGLGAGEGEGNEITPSGKGGGIGLLARPVGAYQIRNDEVTWIPAIDVNRIVLMTHLVAIVALVTVRSIMRHR